MRNIIKIENGITRHPSFRMKEAVNFTLCESENIAIVGNNGAGKSILIDIITGKYPLLRNEVEYDFYPSTSQMAFDNIKYITFRDSYGDADNNYYYQQRWNSQDNDNTPLIRDLLPKSCNNELKETLYNLFGIYDILDKNILLLSSGEKRKYQLTKTLLSNPRVLIMDNPFIGLDAKTRNLLHDLLNDLIKLTSLQIILVLSKTDEIPQFITHVVEVKDKVCGEKVEINEFLSKKEHINILDNYKEDKIINLPYTNSEYHNNEIVKLNNVSIKYGDRIILKELNWQVDNGDRWALMGENGSGKSTLLSLVCADNPQSYACDISLFGYKRGSGESIWDIKKHIGYVSPEMHRAYLKNILAIDVVASGLHDSVGLYVRPRPEQRDICLWWMDIFGIEHLKDANFLQLSSGEQRLILLARAFVKDPQLLILDEPFHGLDNNNRVLVKNIIEAFCKRKNKTLIFVTHYQDELPSVIDHKLILRKNAPYTIEKISNNSQ